MLSPEILSLVILDIIFLFFATLSFIFSVKIYLKWNINSTTKEQYTLEKNSFLTATIIKYIFILKLPLFLYFVFTLDKISNVITGAMCAAGVVDATDYGTYLLILKILNIYLFGFWLMLHYVDVKYENYPYTKLKFGIFSIIYFLFLIEIVLQIAMFYAIDLNKMVSCCGVLYSSTNTSYISNIFAIPSPILLSIFYGNLVAILVASYFRLKSVFSLLNLLFIIVSIISLIVYFGTYIYELPTHHCPFCYLQKDYNYVGYYIYFLLFLGTFNGIATIFTNKYKTSIISNILFTLLVSYYCISYYIVNGVWL